MNGKKLLIAMTLILALFAVLLVGCSGGVAKVTVSFDTLGGPYVSSITVAADAESISLPTPRSREGYTFDYWCYDSSCTERVNESVIPEEDVTFYAKWTKQRITVTFVADGKRQYVFVPYGDGLRLSNMPEVPEKEGYNGRWETGDLTRVTSPVTINAIYTVASFSVTYMVGNEVYYSVTGQPETPAAVPDDPTVADAVFLGWYLDSDFSEPLVGSVNRFRTSNVYLYARTISTVGMAGRFTYLTDSESAVITGLTAEGKRASVLVVPTTYDDKPVVGIADGTEQAPTLVSSYLTTLVLPSSIKTIGDYALYGISTLNELILSEGTQKIGVSALSGLTGLTEISLPSSLTVLSDSAFAGCTALKKLTFAPRSSLTTMGEELFKGCSSLTALTLPDSSSDYFDRTALVGSSVSDLSSAASAYVVVDGVLYNESGTTALSYAPARAGVATLADGCVEIADEAFRYSTGLTGVTFPSSLTTVGKYAFADCPLLSGVDFGTDSGLNVIDEYAFSASGLTSIKLPASVTDVNGYSFYACRDLLSADLSGVVLETVGEYAFAECTSMTSLKIDSVRTVGDHSFHGCVALLSVVFPTTTLTQIGDYAFADCLSLRNVSISNNKQLQSVGAYAFAGLSGHSSAEISLPTTVKVIGDYAFMDTDFKNFLPSLTALTSIGKGVFKNCYMLTRANLPQTAVIEELPDEFFYGCSSLGAVSIPNNILVLGDYAFYGCSNLISVTFNSTMDRGVNTIGESCFEDCVSLTNPGDQKRILPASVTTLGASAFKNCIGLREITIPKNLRVVAAEAFALCAGLTDIRYEANGITDTLGENCFAYCTSLTSVTLPEKLKLRGVDGSGDPLGAVKNPFFGCTALTNLSISANNEDLVADEGVVYQKEGAFRTIYLFPTGRTGSFAIGNDVVAIDDYAFYGAHVRTLSFESYLIVDNQEKITLTSIGDYAFAESSVESATLTKRVYSIGEGAFYNSSLATLTIDEEFVSSTDPAYDILNVVVNNVLTIGESAFKKTVLTSVRIPARVEKIDAGAFADCHSLHAVTFVSGDLTALSLEQDAFRRDGYLSTLAFPTQLEKIGEYAFAECYNVSAVTFSSVNHFTIGDYAFLSNQFLYSVNLPSTLTSVGTGAFADCTRLTDVTVSEAGAVFSIADELFRGDRSLRRIDLPARVGNIGKYAFVGTGLEELSFAEPVDAGETLTIDDYAFYRLGTLTTVTFPADLTLIGKYAFAESGVTSFTYGDGTLSILEYAFASTPLAEVTIKQGVTLDGTHVFADTRDLSTVTVLSLRARIADYTFVNSSVSVVTPYVAEYIGKYAFAYCENLTDAGVSFLPSDILPGETFSATVDEYAYVESGLTEFIYETDEKVALDIGRGAFSSCLALKTFDLAVKSFSIGQDAFAESGLTELVLSGQATSIADGFARRLSALRSISVTDTDDKYRSIDGVVYYVDGADYILLQYPAGKTGSSLYLDEDVTEIADYAFDGNRALTTIVISSAAPVVGNEHSFGSRTDVVAYVAAGDLSSYADWTIDVQAFSQNVNGLILLWLGADRYSVIDYVGEAADVEIPGILSAVRDGNTVSMRVESIAEKAFYNKTNLHSVTLGNGVREVGAYAFAGCDNMISVTFGNNVTTVKEYAFSGCKSLTTVDLNDDLSIIGRYAFAKCSSLVSIDLPKNLTSIGGYAFAGCGSLTDVKFEEKLKSIGDNAFENDVSLVQLHLPASLSQIGNYAFRGCTKLTFLYFASTSVPGLKSSSAFAATTNGLKLFVPAASERNYRADAAWRAYSVNIVGVIDFDDWLPTDYTAFVYGDYVLKLLSFDDVSTFRLIAYLGTEEDYVMPDENNGYLESLITEIGEYAFGPFTRTVVLGKRVEKIDDNAFKNAVNLTSVVLPTALVSIGKEAFLGLSNLTSVTFAASEESPRLTSIGERAFYDCSSLTAFALPAKLTSIGDYAFSGADEMHLAEVTSAAPANVSLTIGERAFANNVDLKTLRFNCMIESFGYGAFADCVSFESLYLNALGGSAPAFTSADPSLILTSGTAAQKDDLVFTHCNHLVVFLPAGDVLQKYKQAWGAYVNSLDRNHLFLSKNLTESYEENEVLVEQDGFVISQNQSGESTATIVSYVGTATEVVFPTKVRLTGSTTDLTVTKIGRDENNSTTVDNGRVISDSVTRVTIPATVVSISGDAFRGAKGLTRVDILSGVGTTVSIGNFAFAECPALTTVRLSYNVSSIGQYAFYACSSLDDFAVEEYPAYTIDKVALSVGKYAFAECLSLTNISFPKHLGTLDQYVFHFDQALESVDFGEESTLSGVGQYCFAYSGIRIVTFPGTVTNVGDNAFAYCEKLTSVRLTRTTAQYSSLTTTSDNVFRGINSVFVRVYVPEANFSQYENATGWSKKSVIPDLAQGEYNYRRTSAGFVTLTAYLGQDKNVVIPSVLTVDGVNYRVSAISAYFGNATVEEFSFREDCQIANVDAYAFAGCSSLRKIHLPDSVTFVGEYCFAECTSLTDVKLSEQMNSFSNYVFYGCTALREVYVPEKAGGIGLAAFLNCGSLVRVRVGFGGEGVPTLGLSAFVNTNEKLLVIVPENLQSEFAAVWDNYSGAIYDKKYLFGDFVVADDGQNGYYLIQYMGDVNDLDFDTLTINGRRVTNAVR